MNLFKVKFFIRLYDLFCVFHTSLPSLNAYLTTLLIVSQTFYALTLRHVSMIHRRSTKCPNRNICKCRRGWTNRWLQDTHASILCLSFFRRDRYPPQQEFEVTFSWETGQDKLIIIVGLLLQSGVSSFINFKATNINSWCAIPKHVQTAKLF